MLSNNCHDKYVAVSPKAACNIAAQDLLRVHVLWDGVTLRQIRTGCQSWQQTNQANQIRLI